MPAKTTSRSRRGNGCSVTSFAGSSLSLLADGGVGKTALRIAQALALASGQPITGEHVFRRGRVLIVSLEDDRDELRRRVKAARLHHGIEAADIREYLFLSAVAHRGLKIAVMKDGNPVPSDMYDHLVEVIRKRQIDLVILDPFVKSHSVEENGNNAIDFVASLLSRLAIEHNIAIDAPHHISKGAPDPGNANRGRGASAFKDAARLVYTMTPMSDDEAGLFNVDKADRRSYVRVDAGKVNLLPPASGAQWFRVVGAQLDNGTPDYPGGDEIQTVETWSTPDLWGSLNPVSLNALLTDIDKGLPGGKLYSDHGRAEERAVWPLMTRHLPDMSETQGREIIRTWIKTGLLYRADYQDEELRKARKGLRVDHAKRPTGSAP